MASKKDSTAKNKGKTGSGKGSLRFLGVFLLMAAVVFLPTTLLLMIGMLPSFVAFFVDRSKKKNKAITVGAMNLAGCTPFLLELWTHDNDFEKSFDIISDPTAIIVMYSASAVGYLIDWAMTGIIANILYHRGVARQEAILKEQELLVERWGPEVTGRVPLDSQGFPLSGMGPAEGPKENQKP